MSRNRKIPRRPFEERFLETEKRFQDLLEHLPVGVYRTTPDGKIVEANQALGKLETLSLKDDLTGLYNRRGFFTIGTERFKLADRERTKMFLLFMDLDDLKKINDTHGHHKGDQALVEIAGILKKTFRHSDVKGRMGGDEFALFPIGTDRNGMEKAISRLKKNIEDFNRKKGAPFHLSVSMGVSHYDPEHPSTIDELLVRADKIMYEEKRRKGRI